jgi:hypothetical protein
LGRAKRGGTSCEIKVPIFCASELSMPMDWRLSKEGSKMIFFDMVKETGLDIVGFSEVNVHWQAVPTKHRLRE